MWNHLRHPLDDFNTARKQFAETRYRWRHRYLHNYEFIHISKTAGSSIKYALGVPWENKHKTAHEKIEELGQRVWDRKFTFTVVRNPWDRAVSEYHYRIRTNQNELGENPIAFSDWIRLTYQEVDPFYQDDPQMFMPQADWVYNKSGKCLVDFICRYERLREDFAHVCLKVGVSADLPHMNATDHGSYRDCYDDETSEIVAKWFRKDIEQFEYTF